MILAKSRSRGQKALPELAEKLNWESVVGLFKLPSSGKVGERIFEGQIDKRLGNCILIVMHVRLISLNANFAGFKGPKAILIRLVSFQGRTDNMKASQVVDQCKPTTQRVSINICAALKLFSDVKQLEECFKHPKQPVYKLRFALTSDGASDSEFPENTGAVQC